MADPHLHAQRQAGHRRLRRRRSAAVGAARPARRHTARSTAAGSSVCKACTSHINGKAFNPCSVPVDDIEADDEITTIEGLPATVGTDLHPMQQAWLDHDVAQCGYCQPGQIMAAVARSNRPTRRAARSPTPTSTSIRNICRCGTYVRIREAIKDGATRM